MYNNNDLVSVDVFWACDSSHNDTLLSGIVNRITEWSELGCVYTQITGTAACM